MRNTPSQPVDLPERGLSCMPAGRGPWNTVNSEMTTADSKLTPPVTFVMKLRDSEAGEMHVFRRTRSPGGVRRG